jgi:16S rRNA (cytosine967-C5)-methyltransferase
VSISPARKLAFETLLTIERGRGFAVDLLQAAATQHLKDADRRLATEVVMGTLRWRGELDFQLEGLSKMLPASLDIEVLTALRMGIYQIRFLRRIPQSAAVNDAVELVKHARKRSAAGFVNAVLRQCHPPKLGPRHAEQEWSANEAVQAACRTIPAWLLARWEQHYGRAASHALAWATVQTPTTVLRVLGSNEDVPRVQEQLASQGIRTRVGKYSPATLVVESGHIAASYATLQDRVVIQDEASQLVAGLIAAAPGQRVLDVAAAPGIKTSQIAAAMGFGFLVAADRSADRLQTLARLWPRISRFGSPLHLVQLDAARMLPLTGGFDRILADVPCSGTGTLARNPEIKWRIQEQDLTRLARAQAAILRNGLQLLAPGGRLVYSTCSLEVEENEAVVEGVLAESAHFRRLERTELVNDYPALENLFDSSGYLRTRPDLHGMDGFFAATIARKG